jgi:NAD(P)-dependent dehydrogenase (short-subunit alcohol dehydrogenase family)
MDFSNDAREHIEDWTFSFASKLLGQVNVVRYGTRSVRPRRRACFDDWSCGAIINTVNAAVEGFVRAATAEPSISVRVNAVSPGWVSETLQAIGRNPAEGIPAAEMAEITVRRFRGGATGWRRPPPRPAASFATRVASVRPGRGSAEPP